MIVMGLTSCDTCRKARKALEAAGSEVDFRDIRAAPLSSQEIAELAALFGEALVNRRSTTWRGLAAEAREESPEALLAAHPALMKRPVIRDGDRCLLGWGPEVRAALGVGG